MPERNIHSPQEIHEHYMSSAVLPRPSCDELHAMLQQYKLSNYKSIGGVLVGSWEQSAKQALALHERTRLHLDARVLVGPYVMSYSLLMPGVMLYEVQG